MAAIQKNNEELKIKEVLANISAGESAKSSKWASWASAFFAFIAVVISYYQYRGADDITEKYYQANLRIDSLSKIQKQTQNHTKGLEDSLKVLKRKP